MMCTCSTDAAVLTPWYQKLQPPAFVPGAPLLKLVECFLCARIHPLKASDIADRFKSLLNAAIRLLRDTFFTIDARGADHESLISFFSLYFVPRPCNLTPLGVAVSMSHGGVAQEAGLALTVRPLTPVQGHRRRAAVPAVNRGLRHDPEGRRRLVPLPLRFRRIPHKTQRRLLRRWFLPVVPKLTVVVDRLPPSAFGYISSTRVADDMRVG